jgi:hypothetical protein
MKAARVYSNFDTHEILKREITNQLDRTDGGSRNGTTTTTTSTQVGVAAPASVTKQPEYGFEDNEFHFDSLNKDSSSSTSAGEILWPIGIINNNNDIQNVVEMKIGTFYFPRVFAPANKPDYFYTRKVYMQVLNLPSTQSIQGTNNQYHFEFDVTTINSVAVKLVPSKDTFFFQKPITSITNFQVRFMAAHDFRRIPLPADTVTILSVANSNPARFSIVYSDTTILGDLGTTSMVAVYISGFISSNATANTRVNDPSGNYVTTVVDANSFEINGIDLTGTDSTYATMVIPKNRIAFPLRFTVLKNQITNRISVVHE